MEDLANEGLDWQVYSFKLADALGTLISGEFQRKVMLIEEELQLKDQMLNGRQLAWLVFQN